ncbi:hypothetical protein V2J09_007693 [Rumex salicifolius]
MGYGSSDSVKMKITSSPAKDCAYTNLAYCSPADIRQFAVPGSNLCLAAFPNEAGVLSVVPHDGIAPGEIGLNAIQRRYFRVSSGDYVPLTRFVPAEDSNLALLTLELEFHKKGNKEEHVDAAILSQQIKRRFAKQARSLLLYSKFMSLTYFNLDNHTRENSCEVILMEEEIISASGCFPWSVILGNATLNLPVHVMTVGQMVTFEYLGHNFIFTVNQAEAEGKQKSRIERGMISSETYIVFQASSSSGIKIVNQREAASSNIFKHKEFNLQSLGIGGLSAEFADIFRRAFASRVFPPHVTSKLGIKHVKGMLLFGPPGTGKTLVARQIGKMLNGKDPKIVNGPEVLSKFVGETEKNVRDLFADAELDQKSRGDESDLHVIIFDEIDAICKSRGSTRDGTGVHDSIVNQLLTKIDGVEALNNVLLIGMTNRKDLLDEALLRPGRLEVQVEIGLPNEEGRLQILEIHTNKMKENSFLAPDISLKELAAKTKNYSGAELEGVVKSAVSYALNRQISMDNLTQQVDEDNIKVTMEDFLNAVHEVKPAFGASTDDLERCRLNGMVDCGSRHEHIKQRAMLLADQVRLSKGSPIMTCLLEGPSGSGKTALAATVGIDSDFPYVKIVFEDAYRSPLSVIVLDDIERLLEYVAIGPRFSNVIAQTLLVLLKRLPPQGKNLLVIGTTSEVSFLDSVGVCGAFSVTYHVPTLRTEDAKKVLTQLKVFADDDIDSAAEALNDMPIKKLYMLTEMSAQGEYGGKAEAIYSGREKISLSHFYDCLQDVNQ